MKNILFTSLLIISALGLAACAMQNLDNGLPRLQGQNIKLAIHYLGYPDNEQRIAGARVYTWGVSRSFTTLTPVTSYSNGNAYGYGGPAAYFGTTTSYIPQVQNYNCAIKIATNARNIITHTQYQGNEGGCEAYAQAMQNIIRDSDAAALKNPVKTKKK